MSKPAMTTRPPSTRGLQKIPGRQRSNLNISISPKHLRTSEGRIEPPSQETAPRLEEKKRHWEHTWSSASHPPAPLCADDCHSRCIQQSKPQLHPLAAQLPFMGSPKDPTQACWAQMQTWRMSSFPLLEQHLTSGGWEPADKYSPLPYLKGGTLKCIPQESPKGFNTGCLLCKPA